jgi:hypothetical protein
LTRTLRQEDAREETIIPAAPLWRSHRDEQQFKNRATGTRR